MHARLVRFSLGPGKRAVAEGIAGDIAPEIAKLPGCGGVTVFGDESDGEYGIFVLWDTEAHANEAAATIRPQLNEAISPHLQGAVDARLFEVISK